MKRLTAADCLWPRVQRVLEEEWPPHVEEGAVFAVYSAPSEAEPHAQRFCGLATKGDIAAHPSWIFADLVGHRPMSAVSPKATLSACLKLMKMSALDALPVMDSQGCFVGAVTQSSLLLGLLKRERALLQEAQHYRHLAEEERTQLEHWSERLAGLHAASRALLSVLAHSTLEENLLQVAIGALTKLLEARYGAIGLLGKDGSLTDFITVGLNAEQVARIGPKPAGHGLLGLVIREDMTLRLEDLSRHPHSAGFPAHHPHMKSLLAVPVSQHGKVYGRIYLCDKFNGEPFTAEDELLTLSFAHSLSLVLDNAHEMEEILKAQTNLDHMAHFDALTNLPNRVLVNDRLKQAIAQAHRQGGRVAVLFVDLDNFKQINDSYGHSIGDQLLQMVAQRLLGCVREGDTVARLSGDEFLLALPDITDVHDAATVAQKVLSTLAPPCVLREQEIFVSASIGVSVFPDDADNVEDLLRFADTAMFHAKQAGRNAWQFFTSSMNERIRRRAQMENALRRAVKRDELQLHYQAQVDVLSGCIVGVEALLRWDSSEMGQVSPAEFIPVAENTGLIVPIGEWVLTTACSQCKRWMDMGFADLRVAVNVSARQFRQKDFAADVRRILDASGLAHGKLELELTESLMMEEIEQVIEVLNDLRSLGVTVSIDDFGTGYSSLNRLKKFPIGMLKIDQSFVRDVTTDTDDAAIAVAIITLGHSLRLRVIAEGVETREQLDFLVHHGCDEIQGYLFSRPLPVDPMTALLREGRRLH